MTNCGSFAPCYVQDDLLRLNNSWQEGMEVRGMKFYDYGREYTPDILFGIGAAGSEVLEWLSPGHSQVDPECDDSCSEITMPQNESPSRMWIATTN